MYAALGFSSKEIWTHLYTGLYRFYDEPTISLKTIIILTRTTNKNVQSLTVYLELMLSIKHIILTIFINFVFHMKIRYRAYFQKIF